MLSSSATSRATRSVLFSNLSTARKIGQIPRSVRINKFVPGFVIVPQQNQYIVERFGRYHQTLDAGLHFMIPFVDTVNYVHSLKEEAIPVAAQSSITADNVALSIDGTLYIRIKNSYNASYNVNDPLDAITQLAQTAMRSEIGRLTLDRTFAEREHLNQNIIRAINEAAADWGVTCLRYEVRDIKPPRGVAQAMELQAEAERKKRAEILHSEGSQQAEVNLATARKRSEILKAEGESEAILMKARATALGIKEVSEALESEKGANAAALRVAEQYIGAFANLAKESSTMIVPANAADPSAMIAQAMAVYGKVAQRTGTIDGPAGSNGEKGKAQNVSIDSFGTIKYE